MQCLLRGTDWIFKSYNFVIKGLIQIWRRWRHSWDLSIVRLRQQRCSAFPRCSIQNASAVCCPRAAVFVLQCNSRCSPHADVHLARDHRHHAPLVLLRCGGCNRFAESVSDRPFPFSTLKKFVSPPDFFFVLFVCVNRPPTVLSADGR